MSDADPMEAIIAKALDSRGIEYVREKNGLDFYLPANDIYIEVKQFHSGQHWYTWPIQG